MAIRTGCRRRHDAAVSNCEKQPTADVLAEIDQAMDLPGAASASSLTRVLPLVMKRSAVSASAGLVHLRAVCPESRQLLVQSWPLPHKRRMHAATFCCPMAQFLVARRWRLLDAMQPLRAALFWKSGAMEQASPESLPKCLKKPLASAAETAKVTPPVCHHCRDWRHEGEVCHFARVALQLARAFDCCSPSFAVEPGRSGEWLREERHQEVFEKRASLRNRRLLSPERCRCEI